MRHRANPRFRQFYALLPADVQRLADRCYARLKRDPRHPSLHFKKIGRFWSVRVGAHYRALTIEDGADLVWFGDGHHSEYDALIG